VRGVQDKPEYLCSMKGAPQNPETSLLERTWASLDDRWLRFALGRGDSIDAPPCGPAFDSGLFGDTLPPGIHLKLGSSSYREVSLDKVLCGDPS
jgi:hypothetical protein